MIYINHNLSRDSYLFGLSSSNLYSRQVINFNVDEIYNVVLNIKPFITIIDDYNFNSIHITNLIKDILEKRIVLSNYIFVIGSDIRIHHTDNSNILVFPRTEYRLMNEYHTPIKIDQNIEYIFSELSDTDTLNHVSELLYPNNKQISVRMCNNAIIKHPQNMGIATENSVLNSIYGCSYYLNINNKYLYDAIKYDKPVIHATDATKNISIDNYQKFIIDAKTIANKPLISEIIQERNLSI